MSKRAVRKPLLAMLMISSLLLLPQFASAQGVKVEASPIPAPTGPHKVGTVIRQWTDSARDELFTTDEGDKRVLIVQFWYPADDKAEGPFSSYMPASDATLTMFERLIGGTRDAQLSLPRDKFAAFQSHASLNAALATDQSSYPVLVFSPGFGATPTMYTSHLEELASHGYIIASINHPYGSTATAFLDGHTVTLNPNFNASANFPVWVQDQLFVIDQLSALNADDPDKLFTGKLDLKHLGIFGHSLGGGGAIKVGTLDSRVSAVLSEDSPDIGSRITTSLQQPFLSMESEHNIDANQAVFQQAKGPAFHLSMKGFEHANFGDFAFWPGIDPLKSASALGKVDPARALKIENAYLLAFFDKYLKGKAATLLDGPSPDFREITFKALNQ